MQKLQPSVLYVASGRQINDLASGNVCLALTYNGDASMAADQAHKANKPYEVAYRIPKEGTLVWQDNLAIPKDAPHPEAARAFIEFMLRPDSVAELTNTLFLPPPTKPPRRWWMRPCVTIPTSIRRAKCARGCMPIAA